MEKVSWILFSIFFICGCSGGSLGATCSDEVRNGLETDVDCGGGECGPCANGLACGDGDDCLSGYCEGGVCVPPPPSCSDEVRNGLETDVDCGGGECGPCADGFACGDGDDCLSGYCEGGVCRRLPDACTDIFFIPGRHTTAWAESVVYEAPSDTAILEHLDQAVAWLQENTKEVYIGELDLVLPVVAWTDPTLPDPDPGDGLEVLAGYVVTDLLWSSKALRAFDPALAGRMERGMQTIGWYGNDLHDVLFHCIPALHFQPADFPDLVHGTSLALCRISESQEVNLRVLTYAWDPAVDAFMYLNYAESAVYQALAEYWVGRVELAKQRIQECFVRSSVDAIFWDPDLRLLVDTANAGSYNSFVSGSGQVANCVGAPDDAFPIYTYKVAVLLYAVRVMGLESDETIAPFLPGLEERLWDAQTEEGGLAHCFNVERSGLSRPPAGVTGEATSAAILAYTAKAVTVLPPCL